MRKKAAAMMVLLLLAICLAACRDTSQQSETTMYTFDTLPVSTQTESSPAAPSEEVTTPVTTAPETEPAHSPLYMDDLRVEDVILYFNEVCLDAEISISGDASLLQKWTVPIYYKLNGNATDEDITVLNRFTAWLNTIEGFPGIYETSDFENANLQIYFCTQQEMLERMGERFTDMDGAVTFWYTDDRIDTAIICCRTDLDQSLRNSVILEELYNSLGPIQDTALRPDSIIYNEYSEPQHLTEIDELILKLLYHPQLLCGMNADECEAVIRQLYY